MAKDNSIVVAPTPAKEFVNVVTVLADNGALVAVPVNADANRLQSQIQAALARKLMNEQLKLYSDTEKRLPTGLLKDLIASAAKVEDMARFAYSNLLTEEEGGEKRGDTPAEMVKAMAEGITNANIKAGAEDRAKRILELGKKKESRPVIIDVE